MIDQRLHEASVRYANSWELAKRTNIVLDKDRVALELEKQRVAATCYDPLTQSNVTAVSCREAGSGNGLCDMCADGHYQKCRYVSDAGVKE